MKYRILNSWKHALPVLLVLLAVSLLWRPSTTLPPEQISATRFDFLLQQDRLRSLQIEPRQYDQIYSIKGSYHSPRAAEPQPFELITHLSSEQVARLMNLPQAELNVPNSATRAKLLEIIPSFLIIGLVGGLIAFQWHQSRSRAGQKVRTRPQVRFADIAGIDEAKAEVQEIVDFLRDPLKYHRLGGRLPKGILLVGPPGTGKTMLAKAIASEAQAHFFSASGSDFNEVFVGMGARRIRQIFKDARRQKPSIIFIDEIDCLGKHRKLDQNGEMQQTSNALLTAMDGFDPAEGVIVIAATNRPEDLDEALLRPGRFDRKTYVALPDGKGRRAILEAHARNNQIDQRESTLALIAQTTPGMSGADLANLLNEAVLLSANRNKNAIHLAELEEARDKVRYGKERKSMVLKDAERRLVAYHEAGHAIVHLQKTLLPPLHKVTIVPRGQSLGSTTVLPNEDQNIHSKQCLLQQLAVLMGGRAAEQVFFGDISNGANGDLDTAKNIARRMIHDWGMGSRLFYEPEKPDAEREINQMLTEACEEALQLIQEQRQTTEQLAEALLQQDTLDHNQVLACLAAVPAAPPATPSS